MIGPFARCIIITVVGVAVLLRLNPEIVLKVPKIGFVLYHFVKGAPIPPYFMHNQWANDTAWLNAGDVVISFTGKSGSTWATAVVHEIRTKGVGEEYRDITDVVPWVDFVRYPGETLEERIGFFKRAAKPFPFAVYKSHYCPPTVKVRPDVKYIIGTRNPVDILASFQGFLATHSKEFSDMWGGFPPLRQSDEEFHRMMLVDKGDGTGMMEDILNFWLGWWPSRNNPNVLVLNYADRVKDARGDILRIANFLEISLTDDEVDRIVAKTDFKWMKKNSNKFSYAFEAGGVQQLNGTPAANVVPLIGEGLIIKGKERHGSEELPSQWVKEMEQLCLRKVGPELCLWLKTGGPLPDVA
jgi:aryl sulfotransferase